MESTFDLNTIIIIIAFLGTLFFISFFISKKKDLLRSHLGSNNVLKIITNSMIGNGNRVTVFEIKNCSYLVVTNKSSISNIILLNNKIFHNQKISGDKND